MFNLPTRAMSSIKLSKAPLSRQQQACWFFHELFPGNNCFNLLWELKIRGPLSVSRLTGSLAPILERHHALKTSVSESDGNLFQVISPVTSVECPVTDLLKLPSDQVQTQFEEYTNAIGAEPFQLEKSPLLRFRLIRISEEEHRLLVAMHHLITDGTSWPVFLDELTAFYAGRTSPSPPIQYEQFAAWQNENIDNGNWGVHETYWRSEIEGRSPVQNLPFDYARPKIPSFRGGVYEVTLSPCLTKDLRTLRKRHGSTLFRTLLACFVVLLHRLSGEEDILVGTTLRGRPQKEFSRLIGFFVNAAAIRIRVNGQESFSTVLARVHEKVEEAIQHEAYPMQMLRASRLDDLSCMAVSSVSFTKLPPPCNRTVENLVIEESRRFLNVALEDLAIYTQEDAERVRIICIYNSDIFERTSIVQILSYFETLLQSVVAKPYEPIRALALLTKGQRIELSKRTNSVRPNNPFAHFERQETEQSIPARFEQMVRQHPDRMAVETTEHQWTYRELNRRANQIAETLLQRYGNQAERIALLFDHGAPMVAAILGVLKSGKTYVPLDPLHPDQRLKHILQDSQARAMCTSDVHINRVKGWVSDALQVNGDEFDSSACVENTNLTISPSSMAYILYTSGSTGEPKGVVQNHRNVLHHIRNYSNSLHINPNDKLTLFSSYSFDAAVMDIFGALLNGASLSPMDLRTETTSGVSDRLTEGNVTIFHSTPTVFRYLFGGIEGQNNLLRVRCVILGGEEVQQRDVEIFKRNFSPDAVFVNGLGPTECTLALQYFLNHDTDIRGKVPVGFPVEGIEILLLNEAGGQADNVYGEIGIRSAHLALGYWRRPQLTDAAFQSDPDGGTRRIFRTGDMGRLLPNGAVAFLGRKDFQVKIRGFRVELAEVESVLSQHPGLRETVVVARTDEATETQLVAYVVPKHEHNLPATDLYSYMKLKLPDYMIPSAFVFLDAIPRTPNGKVDRRRLPLPDRSNAGMENTFVQPRTRHEAFLAGVWTDILGLDRVGVQNNFFELGGHSLLAAQVISQVRNAFQIDLPLRTIFERPTIEELAVIILQDQARNVGQDDIGELLTELEALSEDEAESRKILEANH